MSFVEHLFLCTRIEGDNRILLFTMSNLGLKYRKKFISIYIYGIV